MHTEPPVTQSTSVGATTIATQTSLDIKQFQQNDPLLKPLIQAKLNKSTKSAGQGEQALDTVVGPITSETRHPIL